MGHVDECLILYQNSASLRGVAVPASVHQGYGHPWRVTGRGIAGKGRGRDLRARSTYNPYPCPHDNPRLTRLI